MEVEPATIDQLKRGKDGKMVLIENDVGGIVRQIKDVHEHLCVRYSETGEYWVVFHRHPETGKETLFTTAQALDGRLVSRIQWLSSGEYDYVKELERIESDAQKEQDYQVSQHIAEIGEKLAHAIRHDLGYRSDAARSRKAWGKGKPKGVVGYS